jgi:hypothetical protein
MTNEQEANPTTEHQASRAEHQGADPTPTHCHIYNCIEESAHTVDLPTSTDERLALSARRAATVRLCPACYSAWEEHTDFDRLRQSIDLVRARPPTEALLADVRNLSPAQAALAEAELIQQYAGYSGQDDWTALARKLGNIGVSVTRLVARLRECDAAPGDMSATFEAFLVEIESCWAGPRDRGKIVDRHRPKLRAALARVKGDS